MNDIFHLTNDSLDVWLKLLAAGNVKRSQIDNYLFSAVLLEFKIKRPLTLNYTMAAQSLFLSFILEGSNCFLIYKDKVISNTIKGMCAFSFLVAGFYSYHLPAGTHKLLYFILRTEWMQYDTKAKPRLGKFMDKLSSLEHCIYQMPNCRIDRKMLRHLLNLQRLYEGKTADMESESLKIFNKLMALYLNMLPAQDHLLPFVTQPENVHRIKEYILKNYRQPDVIDIKRLADKFCLSERNLTRIFKEETGLTIQGYLLKLRMDLAYSLLQCDKSMVKNVAQAVGYKDPHYFNAAFKKYFGSTPGQIKNNLNSPNKV